MTAIEWKILFNGFMLGLLIAWLLMGLRWLKSFDNE